MNTDDHPGQGDAEAPCEPALAEALHRALERDARGEPARMDDLLAPGAEGGERLAGALQVAGLLDQFVRHIEEEAGIDFPAPAEGSTQAYEPGHEALPQPFPGEYWFRALLGEGSFGKVWLADDLRLGGPGGGSVRVRHAQYRLLPGPEGVSSRAFGRCPARRRAPGLHEAGARNHRPSDPARPLPP
jgi:hypothetical protein